MFQLENKSIGIIIPDFDNGGEQKRALFFANSYIDYFKKVYLISSKGKFHNYLHKDIIVVKIELRNYFNLFWFLLFLKNNRIHFIQGHKRASLPYLKLAEKLKLSKCNFNVANIYESVVLTKYLLPETVIYLSERLNRYYADKFNRFDNLTIKIGGEFFEPLAQSQNKVFKKLLGIKKEFIITCVGSLSHRKNQQMLIDTMVLLKNENLICLFAGDGKIRLDLEKKARELGVAEKILFLGHRKDIGQILNITDVLIQSSTREGLPNAFIEACSLCIPIISTDVGASGDLVKRNGLLLQEIDEHFMAEAILKVKKRYAHFKKQAKNFYRTEIKNNYSKRKMLENYLIYYNSLK